MCWDNNILEFRISTYLWGCYRSFKKCLIFQGGSRPLQVMFFLFISMVILVQIMVYQHWKESYKFYHPRKSLQSGVNAVASIKKFVLLSEGHVDRIVMLNNTGGDANQKTESVIEELNHQVSMQSEPSEKEKPVVNEKEKPTINENNQPSIHQQESVQYPPEMNATHIYGLLLEPVNAKYTRNIYFTVKTTHKYYKRRLLSVMLSWLQAVDRNKVSIISDQSPSSQIYVDTIRRAGFHIVDTNCSSSYTYEGLCCKLGAELGTYYEAVEKHPGEEENYQWYCHVDDDVYVNVPQLSQFLQQYDSHKPYYLGKWPGKQRGGEVEIVLSNHTAYHMHNEANHTLKQMVFRYATGATYCISYAIMMEAKKFFNGQVAYIETYTLAHLPDDMTIGLTIGILLGYNLTDVDDNMMKNQYDGMYSKNVEELTKYVTVSSSSSLGRTILQLTSSMNVLREKDPTGAFLPYHCLLYPTVSWCKQTS